MSPIHPSRKKYDLYEIFQTSGRIVCPGRFCGLQGTVPLWQRDPRGIAFLWQGNQRGDRVPLCGWNPREGETLFGTRLSIRKSSVLYLCIRLTSERKVHVGFPLPETYMDWNFLTAAGQKDFARQSRSWWSRTACEGIIRSKIRTGLRRMQRYIHPRSIATALDSMRIFVSKLKADISDRLYCLRCPLFSCRFLLIKMVSLFMKIQFRIIHWRKTRRWIIRRWIIHQWKTRHN